MCMFLFLVCKNMPLFVKNPTKLELELKGHSSVIQEKI